MKRLLKQFFYLFLFALFVFPQLEKEIHTWHHADDFHCQSEQTHIHLPQHSCFICEYFFPSITDSIRHFYALGIHEFGLALSNHLSAELLSAPKLFQSLRAPPVNS